MFKMIPINSKVPKMISIMSKIIPSAQDNSRWFPLISKLNKIQLNKFFVVKSETNRHYLTNMVFSSNQIDSQILNGSSTIRSFIFYWNKSVKNIMHRYYAIVTFRIKVITSQFDVTGLVIIINAKIISHFC